MSEYTTITRKLERRRTVISFIASVLIHLLLLLIAIIVFAMNPEWFQRPEPEPDADEPIEFTMLPPPEPEPEEKMFVNSSQTEVADAPPPDAAFESDENSIAASERPPMDQTPVPTTDGEEERSFQLRDQMLTLGPAPMPQLPQPETPEQRTEISPDVLPSEPMPTPLPTATATPEPTPEETPEVPMPEQSDLQLLDPEEKPTPTPTPTPEPTPTPRETPEPEVRRAEAPTKPSSPIAPGYQPESRTTRLTGGISNKGRASVAAEATPLGKYRKMLSDAIGSRWYYYVADLIDLVNIGTVEIRFVVRSDGTVEGVRVLKNSSNESLASVSVRAVIEAEIPPIPPEVVQELEDGRLEVDYSFTIVGR
jgi:outer membrane biosynthesis protein TonB